MADDILPSHTGIRWNGSVGTVEFGGGAGGQLALFYNRSVHNPVKSQEAGRPIFEDKVFIRVAPPGERLNIVDRPATRQDAARWSVAYNQFVQSKEPTHEGTPIDLLYPEKPAVASTLRASGIFTIEACAQLSGNTVDSIGGQCPVWVEAARQYVEFARRGTAATQFRREIEEKDRDIKLLQQQVQDLSAQLAQARSSSASDNRQLAQIQELLAAQLGQPRRTMSKRPSYGSINEDIPYDYEAERVNLRQNYTEEQTQPPKAPVGRVSKPPKSIFTAPDPGYDVQENRINNSDSQVKRTNKRSKPKI